MRWWVLLGWVALGACGSGSTALTGTLDGHGQQAHHAIAVYTSNDTLGQYAPIPDILLSPRADMCALLQKGQFAKNTDILEIQLFSNTATNEVPTESGTYPVVALPNPPSNPSIFSVVTAGTTSAAAKCFDANYANATAGSVSISLLGSRTQPTLGSFDTKFSGGELLGYFYALPCMVPSASEEGAATCP